MVRKTDYNTKTTEIENKIPDVCYFDIKLRNTNPKVT